MAGDDSYDVDNVDDDDDDHHDDDDDNNDDDNNDKHGNALLYFIRWCTWESRGDV